jgi:hypothetical protein
LWNIKLHSELYIQTSQHSVNIEPGDVFRIRDNDEKLFRRLLWCLVAPAVSAAAATGATTAFMSTTASPLRVVVDDGRRSSV